MLAEVWRPIPLNLRYEASSLGRIRRSAVALSSKGARHGRILSQRPTKKGYMTVVIYDGHGKSRIVKTHILVASAFLGPCPKGYEVNHIDLNKANNAKTNLEYVTHSRNCQHALEKGVIWGTRGSKVANSVLTEKDIPQIVAMLGKKTHGQIAKEFGVKIGAICGIANGRNWSWLSGITRKEKK